MSEKTSFAQALNSALDHAMADDENVIMLGEDVADEQGGGVFKVSKGLSRKYGTSRVRSTPISEQAIIGAAVGAAITGMRPVAEIMLMNFITVAMDQLVNHAAKLRFMSGGQTSVPLVVRTTTGAGVGFGGQHSDMLEAWFAHVPGIKIATASNPADAYGLLRSAIEDEDPTILIENITHYGMTGPPAEPGYRVPLGKAAIVRRGDDITLVTYGRGVGDCLKAAGQLAEDGIDAEVIDLRTVSPWDQEAVLSSVARTRRAVIVHEAVRPFGAGAEISARIHEELFGDLAGPVRRVASYASPVPFAKSLETAFLYSVADIVQAARDTTEKKADR
ncbi:alpha-ketoacid dehydrogenase subunit beta [Sphingomonas sp. ID1715]|uniref:alpha-ketoacid dehydrogenase subunit beta n=1 Tax=Sphingomonas sp. ID1715 TaxID=1656898 RepID=UPI0014879E89|nr:alpha-ketoacid dehydrogenase subunit beta [Sphingomonas sp. ID1715]NNM78081.1 alpha-ketoacid dehydrogenase subunit beta [Sphingomonas sp. ID1715]